MSRPSGRRPSSCDQCGSTNPNRGVVRAPETPSLAPVTPGRLSVAQPPYGAPDGPAATQYPVGDGPLQLDPERRAARQFLRPSACGELQTTGKPRTVGRVSSGQFARSLRRSRVRAQYRARGPRPQVVAAGVWADPLPGDRRRATNAAAQLPQSRGVVDRRRAGRRQWPASWALAGVPRGRRGDPPASGHSRRLR